MINRRKYPRFKKIYWLYFIFIEFLLFTYIAQAADRIIREPSWYEHVDLMSALIMGLLSLVGFFIIRLLNRMDKNQSLLFAGLNDINKRLSALEGEHKAVISFGVHKGVR